MSLLGRAWEVTTRAVDGLKTLSVTAVLFLLGLADYMDVVDIKPFIQKFFGEDKSASIMMLLPIVFGTLRFYTRGKPKWLRRHKWQDELDGDDCDVSKEPH